MKWVRCFVMALVFAAASAAWAVQPDEILSDPALEARARTLSRELRCMVCQNQSIDDSDASLARDLRIIVRERLKAGDSDAQVLEFLTSRYGEFVLLKPSMSWHNALLWLAPLIVLVAGTGGFLMAFRRRSAAIVDATPLSTEEERRIQEVINR
jgi:cytochrome c-type biogenesis protein CcmH